jgi:bifunctional aspartokinase / homoserine dehydrogenase 1
MRLVVKFGGTSVGSGIAIKQAAGIVAELQDKGHELLVVTSAMSGVTDGLLGGAAAAVAGQVGQVKATATGLRDKHHDAARTLGTGSDRERAICGSIDQRLAEFAMLCEALGVLGEASPRALDAVSALGERMSVHLLAGALDALGRPARPIDAATIVRTDDAFQSAAPLMEETRAQAATLLGPVWSAGAIPVVTGFIGATAEGVTTTLGRGGSDYSAAILGAAVDASEVWIYTDVDGVMTADPRVVPDVRTLDTLSYREMSELAYFGAKVLHPKTVLPALEQGIPIRIKNTFKPDHPGTLVLSKGDEAQGVLKGVTAIRRQGLVTIEGRGMLGVPGIAARAFGAVARTGTSVSMISQASSEQSICFLVPQQADATVLQALKREFEHELARRDIESIWTLEDTVIVTVVGGAIKQTPGVAGRVFGALGAQTINVVAIAMGSSECSISLVVEAKDADAAVRCLHALI